MFNFLGLALNQDYSGMTHSCALIIKMLCEILINRYMYRRFYQHNYNMIEIWNFQDSCVHAKEDFHLTWFQIALHFLNASCKIYMFIIILYKNKTISDKNDCLYMILSLGRHHKSLQGPLHRHPEAGLLSESFFFLLPYSWANKPEYKPSTSVSISGADIIFSAPRATRRSFSYTRSYAGCGQPGFHVQLLTDVLSNSHPLAQSSPGITMSSRQVSQCPRGRYHNVLTAGITMTSRQVLQFSHGRYNNVLTAGHDGYHDVFTAGITMPWYQV